METKLGTSPQTAVLICPDIKPKLKLYESLSSMSLEDSVISDDVEEEIFICD